MYLARKITGTALMTIYQIQGQQNIAISTPASLHIFMLRKHEQITSALIHHNYVMK
jgi:hypothetical protein